MPKIYDTPFSSFWMDEYGIFNCVVKAVPYTFNALKVDIEHCLAILDGKKAYVLCDCSVVRNMDYKSREYIKKEGEHLFAAFAVLTDTAVGRMMGTFLKMIIAPSVPTKVFTKEAEARKWLKQCKEQEYLSVQ